MFFSTNELQHKDTLAIGLFQKSQLSGKAKEMDELLEGRITAVSYTHLTLPTIYSV